MTLAMHVLFALFLVFADQDVTNISGPSPIERLQAKVSVESLDVADASRLAGHYSNPPKELVRLIGGVLGGNDLYLFPDGTYIYCEWADIQPLTIYDKGKWRFTNGVVELKSDPDVTWDPEADRTYVAVRRRSKTKEILLVGVHSDLPRLETETKNDQQTTLLYAVKKRDGTITRSKTAKVKARLLRECWRPGLFQHKANGPR
jgi:hypothetical protein